VSSGGEDKAQIISFGTLGARAAIRDTARALDIPLNEVDQLARLIPAIPGKPITIEEALKEVPELKAAYEDTERPYIKNLMETAKQLEGISRHASTHAAGVLIDDKPLVEIRRKPPTKGGEGGRTRRMATTAAAMKSVLVLSLSGQWRLSNRSACSRLTSCVCERSQSCGRLVS
jgi:DNA polymerase-3 subunit alpha